jgi:hypothetical protein
MKISEVINNPAAAKLPNAAQRVKLVAMASEISAKLAPTDGKICSL